MIQNYIFKNKKSDYAALLLETLKNGFPLHLKNKIQTPFLQGPT